MFSVQESTVNLLHPKLIVCDISGYGATGPYRDKKAYDLLIQSESGFLSVTGTADQPSKAGNSIADISAGMYAHSSILAALLKRSKTGEGSHIDISMLESMVEWMSYPLYYAYEGAAAPLRTGASHATIFPYGPFSVGDGKTVMFGLQNEREWKDFCAHVLLNDALAIDARFTSNAKRVLHRTDLTGEIERTFLALTLEQVTERLDRAKIANARVNDMHAVWEHEQLRARGRWVSIESPNGDIPALLPPGLTNAGEMRLAPVPTLGQHTDAILTELGYVPEAIAALRLERAI